MIRPTCVMPAMLSPFEGSPSLGLALPRMKRAETRGRDARARPPGAALPRRLVGAPLLAARFGLDRHSGVALALLRGHRADLQRAFLELALHVLKLRAATLCCPISLCDHT